ncbi:hypothetical protein ENUP19_0319G0022 [Entamoeba nuttalli]|uniref:Tc3 transposase DNA binding domain-containing protein n=2 Tax=Entamoeba nuttalli TaxID=412467 RepID=K2G594_ENTNP|nr:hypothetical protein ENU1_194840 [Entamoeba nuttalli P19]EKE37501.1 hypothetical protein ENU1_194840 [Entamoeba nuttalli P19]|eukprot:XP_008860159.1 hypothetical protein ENU1_194840 [Entamoeba nuttalli P19]
MISPRRPLTDDIKLQIINEKEQNGSSVYAIAKKLGRSPSTVRCFLKCYGNDHQLSRKRGRKPKLTDEIEEFIAQFSDNKDISCSKIAAEIKKKFPDVSLSKETVRVIRQKLHKGSNELETPSSGRTSHYGEFENGVFIGRFTQKDEDERKEFAAKILELNRPIVLSSTAIIGVGENGVLTRCNKGEMPVFTAFTAKGKLLEITVWGAIANGWKSPLINIKGDMLLGEALKNYGISDEVLEKFGPHVFLDERMLKGEIFPFLEFFPHDSSDLNPLNDLFSKIQVEVKNRQFRNEEELISFVEYLWNIISMDDIQNYIQQFYDRINHCVLNPCEGCR